MEQAIEVKRKRKKRKNSFNNRLFLILVAATIPHLGRMLAGPGHTRLLPVSALLGGLFLLVVDTLTRTIGAEEMPVSILTGLVGAPFYGWLLWRQRRAGHAL